jgi:hypothetical protein
MKDDLETLKCHLRFVISFRATALSIGTHSVSHAEIRLNFQESLENLAIVNGLFNCQHADIVIADAEMVVFSLNVGICDLIVKKLSGLGTAFDPAGLVVQ